MFLLAPPQSRLAEGGGVRKKSACVRAWLLVEPAGEVRLLEIEKHEIMRRTGLPARDLRVLDPVLSNPSRILGRERAIVVNLEHVKAIITAQEVMFLNSRDPLVSPFVEKLQGIFRHRHAIKSPQEAGEHCGSNVEWPNLYNLDEPRAMADQNRGGLFSEENKQGNGDGEQQVPMNANGLKLLPFEFVALEACLEAACSSLDNEARTLEKEAHSALDKLTSKVSTLNLEGVRQLKSRLVAITGRVQKVRDELEHLLDDDEDMAELYLTEKFEQQQLESSSNPSMDRLDVEIRPYRETTAITFPPPKYIEETDEPEDHIIETNALRRNIHRAHPSTRIASEMCLDVAELEMILEAYFVQTEGTLHKLSNLRENVDDTEDYINIMLDDKQNNLLQMGVMLTSATLVTSAFVAITGVFGMNITIELFNSDKAGMKEFLWTVGGSSIGCVFLYVTAIAWCRYKQILQ